MPSQVVTSVENNFTKGLITEATGLNFPENAATDTQNCIYTLVGDVTRREGFDYEANAVQFNLNTVASAMSSYKWDNVGGDGQTQVVVVQTGNFLNFYKSSSATVAQPLSTQRLSSVVDLTLFTISGGTFDATQECQFADGNGYLFIFHPSCDPAYAVYNGGLITANTITIRVRDFLGVSEPNLPVNTRPSSLTKEHQYNLTNQGWTSGNPWSSLSSTQLTPATGTQTFFIQTGLTISNGTIVNIYNNHDAYPGTGFIPAGTVIMSGTVTSYTSVSGALVVNVTYYGGQFSTSQYGDWGIVPINIGFINSWFTAEGNYPSNSDVWWYFKDATDAFNPGSTAGNVTSSSGNAPKGHYVLNAFNQQRSASSGIAGITSIVTQARPTNGCWFQGRIWYAGVNASQQASGDANFYTWTENIYFSQTVDTVTDFGNCYQVNDPTSENLFGLLPTDGGVISIQGCGNIYKLFPLFNALLVFASNGVWYISGSQGVGFAANDYTIVKLSAVKSMSNTSFIDINGLPIFWNEEGIYQVEPSKQGTQLLNSPLHVQPLEVNPLTVGTILTYYNNIPLQSKKYARGTYSPIDYTVQWCFKSINETSI